MLIAAALIAAALPPTGPATSRGRRPQRGTEGGSGDVPDSHLDGRGERRWGENQRPRSGWRFRPRVDSASRNGWPAAAHHRRSPPASSLSSSSSSSSSAIAHHPGVVCTMWYVRYGGYRWRLFEVGPRIAPVTTRKTHTRHPRTGCAPPPLSRRSRHVPELSSWRLSAPRDLWNRWMVDGRRRTAHNSSDDPPAFRKPPPGPARIIVESTASQTRKHLFPSSASSLCAAQNPLTGLLAYMGVLLLLYRCPPDYCSLQLRAWRSAA